MLWGIERMDEVRFAVLERNGDISIVPRDRPQARGRPSAAGAAEG
jgi:uncharacterized membrane protein YcaP (DUF421 family)